MYKTKYKVTKNTYREIINGFKFLKLSTYFVLLIILLLMYISYVSNSLVVLFGSYFIYLIVNLFNGFFNISNYEYYKELSLNNGKEAINELEFNEKKIEAYEKTTDTSNSFKYKEIYRVLELKNYFILILENSFSLVVVKNDIKDKDAFITFLKTKCDYKFINVNFIKILRIISMFLPIIFFILYFCK